MSFQPIVLCGNLPHIFKTSFTSKAFYTLQLHFCSLLYSPLMERRRWQWSQLLGQVFNVATVTSSGTPRRMWREERLGNWAFLVPACGFDLSPNVRSYTGLHSLQPCFEPEGLVLCRPLVFKPFSKGLNTVFKGDLIETQYVVNMGLLLLKWWNALGTTTRYML